MFNVQGSGEHLQIGSGSWQSRKHISSLQNTTVTCTTQAAIGRAGLRLQLLERWVTLNDGSDQQREGYPRIERVSKYGVSELTFATCTKVARGIFQFSWVSVVPGIILGSDSQMLNAPAIGTVYVRDPFFLGGLLLTTRLRHLGLMKVKPARYQPHC